MPTPPHPHNPHHAPGFPVAAFAGSRSGTGSGRRRAATWLLLLASLLPVFVTSSLWSNPTVDAVEYARLARTASAIPGFHGPRREADAFDVLLGLGGAEPRPVAASRPAGDAVAAGAAAVQGLGEGRRVSRSAGLLLVLISGGLAWRVVSGGRRGRFGGLLGASPEALDARRPAAPAVAAALAMAGTGLCLPLVHFGGLLSPVMSANAALIAAAALAWHAAAGPPDRRLGAPAAVAAAAATLLACALSPAVTAAAAGLAAWAIPAAALRLRRQPDAHRRFRDAMTSVLLLLLVLTAGLALHYAGAGSPLSALLRDPLPVGGDVTRTGPLRLLSGRLGWVAWATPVAMAVVLWSRPAAGSLLALLAGAALSGASTGNAGTESQLVPFVWASLLALAVAAGVVLPRVHGSAATFLQACAERVGAYAAAPAAGRGLAAIALAGLVAWGAWRSPAYYLTAAVLRDGPGRGPYARMDFAAAAPVLQAALRAGDAVATSVPDAARLHLGRADVLLSRGRLAAAIASADGGMGAPGEGRDAGFALVDPASGLPVVGSVEGVRSLLRERRSGLVIVERFGWKDLAGLPLLAAEEIERRAVRVPLPPSSGLYAFRWSEPPGVGVPPEAQAPSPDRPMGRGPAELPPGTGDAAAFLPIP